MLNIKIDGIDIKVKEGTNIIDAAEFAGIEIPQLCYIKDLSPFAGCRMCVVEIKGRRGYQAACSTLVQDGMEILTETEGIREYRKGLLKLYMSNHPNECLTCNAVGHCDLHDLVFKYQVEPPFYQGETTTYKIDDGNPVIMRNLDKCIKCGKCVKICNEIQVTGTYDFIERGFRSVATTAYNQDLNTDICRMCGQCAWVCPTGAIVNKQLMNYRPWELEKVRTTCPFCGTGCQFELNLYDGKIVGVTPVEDAPINQTQMCVKGRFGVDFVHSPDRLTKPLMKKDGKYVEVSWDEALNYTAEKFLEIRDKHGADAVAGLASARCTNEDNFAFQKLFRVFGTNSIDHCART